MAGKILDQRHMGVIVGALKVTADKALIQGIIKAGDLAVGRGIEKEAVKVEVITAALETMVATIEEIQEAIRVTVKANPVNAMEVREK